MRPLNFFERLWDKLIELKKFICSHRKIILSCKSNELFDGYGDYAGFCDRCDKMFRVIINK